MATTGHPTSFKRRAIFAPMRPTPTKPIRSFISFFIGSSQPSQLYCIPNGEINHRAHVDGGKWEIGDN
jgi:hypothetical protein